MLEMLRATHDAFPWFFTGTFFVFGAIVGSFLNVCIFRIPKGESIVVPGSHCDCGKPIPLHLNVPVLAWIFLRGRAACCGRKISFRHPAVELLTALVFACAWHFLPWDAAVHAMIFSAFGIVLAFIDWDTMYLPDAVNAPFVLAGLFCAAAFPHALGEADAFSGLFAGTLGLIVGSMLIFWFRYFTSLILRRETMGEGDVILLGGIGAFCGWRGAIFAFFASAFIGLFAWAIARACGVCTRGNAARRACEASRLSLEGDDDGAEAFGAGTSAPFPLGPWLILGGALYLACGEKILAVLARFCGA